MLRITDPSAVVDKWGAGKPGFTDGDPLAGIGVTYLNAAWFDGVQEELVRTLEGYGLVPSGADLAQLLKAVRRAAGGNSSVRAASGTLTADDAGVVAIAAAGDMTLTLPLASAAGGRPIRYTFVRTDTTTAVVALARAGTDIIEGLTTIGVPVGSRMTLVSDGNLAWRLQGGQPLLGGMGVYIAGGSFVVPAGVRRVKGRGWGGGGGGAGNINTSSGTSGGGGGGYFEGIVDVVPGQVVPISIGAAGIGGANTVGANGTPGGITSFGSFMSATGGQGGRYDNASGGIGGVGVGGQINISGDQGGTASPVGGSYIGGYGGTTFCGAPAGPNISGQGLSGRFPGGGGSGSSANNYGGNGAPGYLIVEW
ncbi:hypothetical protein ACQW02_25540 [Humitalea sp. 24SJ18S-53]|uniref:glycine-rich domain-containing protein n=1 Tax=Humitalea sp. 24SJ18S-53 TaxID=3422307 RepID=UPI003D66BE3D